MAILKVNQLSVSYKHHHHLTPIIHQISFDIKEGECVGLIGESGSGKSMASKAILGLLPSNFVVSGRVMLNGVDWYQQKPAIRRKRLAQEIGIILQNPMNAFDPLMRIERQMEDYLKAYKSYRGKTMTNWLIQLLESVEIKNPEDVLKKYPHQLSGGMLQRIMIAISMALEPSLLIADEPTTAIDTKSQKEVIRLLQEIKRKGRAGILFISHDIGVVSAIADRIILLKEGQIVETSTCCDFMSSPLSAYGQELLACRLKIGGCQHAR